VEEPVLAVWRGHIPNWAVTSYREKTPQEPGFSGKKGRMLETGLHKNSLNLDSSGPRTLSAESNYY
jgi:hypothetical protein